MSLTVLGWLLIVSSIALSALCLFQLRSGDWRWENFSLELGSPRLEDIGSRFKFGKANDGTAGPLVLVAAVLLLVPIVGAATSHLGDRRAVAGSEDTDEGMLARLADYTRSIEAEKPARNAAAGNLLPDVNTMIERLAARLRTTPDDIQGWRTLGWSYFNTGLYGEAASAYAKAVELDPNSAELKAAYEEAKAKASEGDDLATTPLIQPEADDKSHDGPTESTTKAEASPPLESDSSIRLMVDGLATRLESSPRDVEGWARLMRSRVVLGEREIADTAFRKALEIFKDDSVASATLAAAAIELGLRAE